MPPVRTIFQDLSTATGTPFTSKHGIFPNEPCAGTGASQVKFSNADVV